MRSGQVQPIIDLQKLRSILEQSKKAMSATAIAKPLGLTGPKIKSAIAQLLEAGTIYEWTKTTYSDKPKPLSAAAATDLAMSRILKISGLELITSDQVVDAAATEVPLIDRKLVEKARKRLVKEMKIREMRLPGPAKKAPKWQVNVQHPAPYLVAMISNLLASFGLKRPPERIQALISDHILSPPVTNEAADLLFTAMNRIAFAPGTTVTFHRLRQQPELASLSKAVFDQAALQLQSDRKALLSEHGHAPRLPKEEQDELVTDGLGNFYVSIYSL